MSGFTAAVAVAGLVLLTGLRSSPRARLSVGAAQPRVGSGRLPWPVVAVAAAAATGVLLHVPLPVVVVTVGAAPVAHFVLLRRRRRLTVMRRTAECVEVVFALAAELRAGRPPGRALALVGATATELRVPLFRAAAAVDAGATAAAELRQVARLPGCAGLLSAAAAWEVTEAAGGAVADVLDRLGEVVDADAQNRAALAAALAAPRATIALLAALPMLGLALGQSLGAHPVHLLLHRPLGWALLSVAALLDCVGVGWTRLLVRRALR